MNRRDFVHAVAAAVAGPLLAGATEEPHKTIAIQFGAVSLIDEGIDAVLDIFQERAGVNALIPWSAPRR